jgi:aspartyl/glutamyl-tRNA(Asn/Gln) amidotransferase C subunit
MLEIKDIEKLSKLSRIDLNEEQKSLFLKGLGAILVYVDQIKNAVAEVGEERKVPELRNVSRQDEPTDKSGDFTDAIVAEFPDKKDNYLKVKKILGN